MQKNYNRIFFKALIFIAGFIIILFIIVPLISMIATSSPIVVLKTSIEKEVLSSIFLTLRASFFSTIFAFISGIPLAYLLVRFNFPGKKIIEAIVDIPVIIPHSAAGIALLTVWGRHSLFGKITGVSVLGTEFAICIAMFFVSVSFFVNNVKSGFKLVDYRYEKVAITLGATPLKAFFTVALPLVRKSIIAGAVMMWARGISEFGAVIVLAYYPMVTPILIYDRYESFGLKYAKPVAVLLILICLIIFIVIRILEDFKKKRNR